MLGFNLIGFYKDGSKIFIKKKNRGKFTESAKKAGESVLEHADSVLANPHASKLLKKRALFAKNAAKWNKNGDKIFGNRSILDNGWISTKDLKHGTRNT